MKIEIDYREAELIKLINGNVNSNVNSNGNSNGNVNVKNLPIGDIIIKDDSEPNEEKDSFEPKFYIEDVVEIEAETELNI